MGKNIGDSFDWPKVKVKLDELIIKDNDSIKAIYLNNREHSNNHGVVWCNDRAIEKMEKTFEYKKNIKYVK